MADETEQTATAGQGTGEGQAPIGDALANVMRMVFERGQNRAGAWARWQAILALFRSCVERRRPIHSLTNYLHPDRPHSTVERLMMPLRGAGDDVTIVLTIQLFHDAPDLVTRPLRQVVEETVEAGDAFRFQAHVVM